MDLVDTTLGTTFITDISAGIIELGSADIEENVFVRRILSLPPSSKGWFLP